jgi:chromosome segregation ATPase
MQNLDEYIPKLGNNGKILKITEKIVNNELKIDKYESKRSVIKQCIKEMENKMFKLHEKSLKYPKNEKIGNEIEDTENKLRKGIKALNGLNDKIIRKEIALIKLKQEKEKEIKSGLTEYLDNINFKHEKLHQEITDDNRHHNDRKIELEKMENEIKHIKQLIEIEFNSK